MSDDVGTYLEITNKTPCQGGDLSPIGDDTPIGIGSPSSPIGDEI